MTKDARCLSCHAIDTGANPSGLATDQRGAGFARVVGGVADIGAFEVAPVAPPAVRSLGSAGWGVVADAPLVDW